eukprot:GHVP01039397.1.p1 GENE.GHVP01039397.1~~GHVP01039397.1.p1  ORF type:complete len:155 (+),score=28.02 GHVP01039397.1:81-545(+)
MELLIKKSVDDVLVTAVPYDNLEESNGSENSTNIQDNGFENLMHRKLPHQDKSNSSVTDTDAEKAGEQSVFQARQVINEAEELRKSRFTVENFKLAANLKASQDLEDAEKHYKKAKKYLEKGKSNKVVSHALRAKDFADQAKQKINNCWCGTYV